MRMIMQSNNRNTILSTFYQCRFELISIINAAPCCGISLDHIKPIAKGGKTEIENLRTLCDICNHGKQDKYDPAGPN